MQLVRSELVLESAAHVRVKLASLVKSVLSVRPGTVDKIAQNVLVILAEQCPAANANLIASAR